MTRVGMMPIVDEPRRPGHEDCVDVGACVAKKDACEKIFHGDCLGGSHPNIITFFVRVSFARAMLQSCPSAMHASGLYVERVVG